MRLVCVVPLLPLSLLIFFFAPDLSAGREREKERRRGRARMKERERERKQANKPLRRAFSHSVVKGKGAIVESLPRRAVSVRRNRTTTRRESERNRG